MIKNICSATWVIFFSFIIWNINIIKTLQAMILIFKFLFYGIKKKERRFLMIMKCWYIIKFNQFFIKFDQNKQTKLQREKKR